MEKELSSMIKSNLTFNSDYSNILYARLICKNDLMLPDALISSSTFKEVMLKIESKTAKKFVEILFPIDETFLALNPDLLSWDETYHGSPVSSISSILRHGDILRSGDVLLDGSYLENFSSSDGAENPRDAVWTTCSPSFAFKYTTGNSKKGPRIILKLLQKPKTYSSIYCNRAESEDSMEGRYSLKTIGNYTKNRRTIYLLGLILDLQSKDNKAFNFLALEKELFKTTKLPSFKQAPCSYDCRFANDCYEFVEKFAWPNNYFDPDGFRCYCPNCYLNTWSNYLDQSGERYIIPRNWCRFGLRVSKSFALINDIWESWCNAFHGTTVNNAKSIVEHQGILINGDSTKTGNVISTRSSVDKKQSNYFITPSIDYASHPWYSEIKQFHNKNNKIMYAQIVLAMKVRPGTYDKQRETEGGAKKIFDDYRFIAEDEIEWFSKRRGCVVPYGILIRVFDETKKKQIEKVFSNDN